MPLTELSAPHEALQYRRVGSNPGMKTGLHLATPRLLGCYSLLPSLALPWGTETKQHRAPGQTGHRDRLGCRSPTAFRTASHQQSGAHLGEMLLKAHLLTFVRAEEPRKAKVAAKQLFRAAKISACKVLWRSEHGQIPARYHSRLPQVQSSACPCTTATEPWGGHSSGQPLRSHAQRPHAWPTPHPSTAYRTALPNSPRQSPRRLAVIYVAQITAL